ncbi:MAG: glycosyltransferase family 39 protein, partial [Acidobacteria bacterium]|nr:glycosyltransferase family 39 protein [Acidobacteriota bacterium]
TSHGFLEAFQNAGANEKQAPLYFWIMALWRDINASIFFARLFSVICSAVSIKLFARVANHLFAARTALLATAFFALHPFLIWASLEIRVYALVILLTVALLDLFFRTFIDEGAKAYHYIAFALLSIAAVYTNYYLAFPLAGMFASLIATGRWRSALRFAGIGFIACLAFLPVVVAARSQLAANTGGYQEARVLIDGLRTLWHHSLTFVLPAGVFADGDEGPILVVRVWVARLAIVAALVFAVKNRAALTQRTLILAVIAAACLVFLLAAYFVLGERYLEIRHAAVLFAPLLLAAASFIEDIFSKEKEATSRFALFASAFFVLLSFAYSLTILYPNMAKRGDWARIGRYIEDNEKPGQPIIVFTAFDALALPNHYHGVNTVLPDHGYFDYDLEAEFGKSDSLKKQTDFVISQIPSNADEIWLAVGEKCTSTAACEPLENFIRANYTIETEQHFYLEKLYLLKKNTR